MSSLFYTYITLRYSKCPQVCKFKKQVLISEIHEIEIPEKIPEIPEIQGTDESELPGTSQGSEQPDMTETDLPDDLPRKQKFTSLADVCDIENYSLVTASRNKKTYTYRDAKGTMTMNWSNVLPSLDRNPRNNGRRSAQNITQTVEGCPSIFAKNHAKSVLESWELFIEDDFLTPAVEATNKKIERYREYFQQHFEMTHHKTECKPIDITEIKAFLEIMYIRASLNLNLMAAGTIFSHESITSLFQTTMSCKRFSFLCRFIKFDDLETRLRRWKEDKFACIREFFEKVNNQHAKMQIPSAHLAIDETLYPYRGVIGTKQYNQNKPPNTVCYTVAYVILLSNILIFPSHMLENPITRMSFMSLERTVVPNI